MSIPQEGFHFEASDHTYWWNGRRIPGTTEILKSAGVISEFGFNEHARVRGTAVHAACHYLAEGDLDMASVDPAIVGYVKAYEQFLVDTGFKPEICEKPTMHPVLLYGTTPDQIGPIKGQMVVVDFKTGTMRKWTALQTAFQTMATFPDTYLTIGRACLELHEDGTYKPAWFTDETDFDVAMGMLTVLAWKNENMGGTYKK